MKNSTGVGYLSRIIGGMDAELYTKILDDEFLATLDWYNLDKRSIFLQQDNDPKHTSRLAKEWIKRKKIPVLEFPPQSPDLNPIENLWNEMSRALKNQDRFP